MLQNELKSQGEFLFRYRGYLPLIVLFAGLGVFIGVNIKSIEVYYKFSEGWYMFICLTVSLSGQIIRIITVGHTPANTSGRNTKEQIADEINTTGIYSLVRHPLYIGNFFMWLGLAMLTKNVWFIISFILLFWIYYERIMYAEEEFLFSKFGHQYKNWADQTGVIIPAFKNYRKPKFPFSWKKILKKEKNGIAGIFLLFFLFDFTGHLINAGRFVILFNFWFYAAIISLMFYLILKYLKRKTAILDEEGR